MSSNRERIVSHEAFTGESKLEKSHPSILFNEKSKARNKIAKNGVVWSIFLIDLSSPFIISFLPNPSSQIKPIAFFFLYNVQRGYLVIKAATPTGKARSRLLERDTAPHGTLTTFMVLFLFLPYLLLC